VKRIIATGSSGLIGSEAVASFDQLGWDVHGVDNNMRRSFFGSDGDTTWNLERLRREARHFTHHDLDVRDGEGVSALFKRHRPDLIIHCAAQPSHDLAARRDNLHSYDVYAASLEFYRAPRSAAVYNLGGGRANSVSILEAIERCQDLTGKTLTVEYVETSRLGDHITYISDMRRRRADYPHLEITRSLDDIFRELTDR